ncbi:N-acetylmuramoyl-L-alanine amidase [Streptomyces sp. NRRL F-5650]|uniref:N-acetylmuramoyl-L-alanine amidase n=1 Tax=Streptomyces sp. NRRL F-5650 TaxID=1463868 RepID=UPI000A427371|nr:N-acetylmuramoyl-L-alanine amidase [Streptomyces sp. NRRL F-5650]
MAEPMSYGKFLAALRAEGLTVIEEKTGGRPPSEHNRNHKGAWGPVHGVMIHHTVTRGHDSTVDICRKGYASLPGPLCHGVICKQGHVHVVGYGRANHAGLGDGDVLRAVIAEKALPPDNEADTDGNRHFYGFECENLGDGKDPWPAAQLLAIERAAAAICRHHGWDERSVIGHLEWQPGKVDPRGFTMASMRARVAARLHGKTPTNSKQEDPMAGYSKAEIGDAVLYRDNIAAPEFAPDVKKNPKWSLSSYIRSIYNAVITIRDELRALRKAVDALAQKES